MVLLLALVAQFASAASEQNLPPLRPPAVPLVAHDPYFSIWSPADKLTDADTVHWTGKPHRLTSLVRIDGKGFRLMGKEPTSVPALPQTNLEVLPTRTIYTFEGEGVRLTMTFMTPALPEDLDVLSRPVTFVTWDFKAVDGKEHEAGIQFDASGEIAVNNGNQIITHSSLAIGDLTALKLRSVEQAILATKGDDLRIDWGDFYVAGPSNSISWAINAFVTEKGNSVIATLSFNPLRVSIRPISRWLMLAYDDEFSIQYMKKNLRPYWRRPAGGSDDAAALLKKAAADYESLKQRCEKFDAELMADLRKAGGEKYARLAALAYRQCFAAGKFVAADNGQPLQFSKENHSNGCIGTSDVFYPMSPQFLLFGPSLAKSFLVPFMNYAASERWKFPFAPHDLGTYPHANGQVYGGGERSEENQMPVEESGNLLILMAAIAHMEGHADFAGLWWPTLEKWAEYLKARGFDPENQLCTDDFAGHLAHNVNLSAKAIMGLGSFAKLCDLRGEKEKAAEYWKLAREFAQRWVKEADDGDHFRLAFDKPGTWSQKYNLVWDRILGLNRFPAEVARKEMEFYKRVQNAYGLPLDNRSTYTKLDWILWTATLTQNRADFEALIDPVYKFLNETPDRSPMTDWYFTDTAKKRGFTARPVVGAVFLPLLYDKPVWQKWASRDTTKAANWSPIPPMLRVAAVIPAADSQPAVWRYTTTKPANDWAKPGFEDSAWKEGESGFSTRGTPGAIIGTVWNTPEIWLRREVEIPADKLQNLELRIHHDEDAVIYINGVAAAHPRGYVTDYFNRPPNAAGQAAFKPGRNLIAVHCRQTGGGQYIDVGFVEVAAADATPPVFMRWADETRIGRPFSKDPSVIRFNDRYLMYFSLPPSTNKLDPPGWAIGIAESADLVNWRRVGELLPAQECDCNGLCAPGAIVLNGRVHLFYQTYGNGPKDAICHAVSSDGVRFTRDASNPVFRPTGAWNNGRAIDAEAFPVGNQLMLYFATRDPTGKIQKLGVATADLQSDFNRNAWRQACDESILQPELSWERDCIEAPSVCARDGTLFMFYAGGYNNAPQQIGVATSRDGLTWTRLSHEPFLANGGAGDWNSSESGHPGVFVDHDGQSFLFFQGNNDCGRTWWLAGVKLEWVKGHPQLAASGIYHR